MSALIHETATIDPTAYIGPGASVGAHSTVGAHCRLEAYAIVGAHTHLGARNHVHSFAVVGGPAQDRRTPWDAPYPLVCGDDNVFREGVTVSRGSAEGASETRIGHHVLLMAHSHVAHDCLLGDFVTLANGVSLAGHVTLGNRVTIGGHAAVHQFCRVGTLAFIAANGMVNRDVPPYCLAAGDRATLRGLNTTGLKRADIAPETRRALQRAFHALLRRSPSASESESDLKDTPFEAVRELIAFMAPSRRGIMAVERRRGAVPDPSATPSNTPSAFD